MIGSETEREAEFIIRAPFSTWRQVIEGKLDPIQGMMTRQLKLQGNMMKIMRYPKAAKEIVSCCALVPDRLGVNARHPGRERWPSSDRFAESDTT